MYLVYSYNATTYIDHQTMVPSFWFRWWRPGFLIAGILYDVGMLAYSIYSEDVSAVLLAVRITVGLYQVSDQLWLIKHWVRFFVQQEKQRFLIFRFYIIGCIWFLVLCSSSSGTTSWQKRNEIFANVYYIMIFLIIFGCGLPYLIQGGVESFVQHRFHWTRNTMICFSISDMILGIVGLIIGDGGGNNLVETSNYHSTFVMIYCGIQCSIAVIVHRFMVVFEELSWKYPNPIISQSTPSRDGSMTLLEAPKGVLSASNKVVCDVNVPPSTIEGVRMGSIPDDTVVVAPLENHTEGAIGDTKASNDEERMVEKDGKSEGGLEATNGLISQSVSDAPSVISPLVTAPARTDGIDVPYQAHRRFALAFDGITRSSSMFRSNVLTEHIMKVRLKRHVLVCREIEKLYSVLYQILVWETVMWLAQIFVTLYLQSVNTPTLPGHDGYYCQTPLENTFNSAQFVNDFVFARRR